MQQHETTRKRSVAGNVIRGSIGNLIEWYDWYAYAAFSVYFAAAFFPSGDQTAQLLNTAARVRGRLPDAARSAAGCSAGTPTVTAGERPSRSR